METATEEQTAELTPAQAEAEEEAGFNSTIEQPTGSETDTPVRDQAGTPSPDVAETSEETPEPVEFKAARISEEEFQRVLSRTTEIDQIKAAIEQRYNGLGGKIGGIERLLNELRTGTGKKAEVSRDDMKELLEEYPEFGERAITGLNRALAKIQVGGGSSGLTAEQAEEIYEQKAVTKEIARLDKKQKDWREIVGLRDPVTQQFPDTAYRRWLALQDEDYRTEISNSTDSGDILESITKFNSYVASKTTPKPKPKTETTERERELRRAVQPKSVGGGAVATSPQDEETAMLDAYKAEQRKRGS
mgnify:CR=1 FL=1